MPAGFAYCILFTCCWCTDEYQWSETSIV